MGKKWVLKIGNHEKKIIEVPRLRMSCRDRSIKNVSQKTFSQSSQDNILEYIFKKLLPVNIPPFCVEFGFNADTLEGGVWLQCGKFSCK